MNEMVRNLIDDINLILSIVDTWDDKLFFIRVIKNGYVDQHIEIYDTSKSIVDKSFDESVCGEFSYKTVILQNGDLIFCSFFRNFDHDMRGNYNFFIVSEDFNYSLSMCYNIINPQLREWKLNQII